LTRFIVCFTFLATTSVYTSGISADNLFLLIAINQLTID